MKLDLLTNATVVDDAIRLVSDHSKDKPKLSSSNSSDDENANNREGDRADQQEEQEHDELGGTYTINQVF
jgi:hypothetical protein